MHVSRGKVYYNLSARNPESHRLQGGDGPEQAFLYCSICKPDQMDSYSCGDVHLNCDRHGIDSNALCAMNVYKHILFSSKIVTASGIGFKKGKNVVESDHKTNFNMQRFILMW